MTQAIATAPCPLSVSLVTAFANGDVTDDLLRQVMDYTPATTAYSPPDGLTAIDEWLDLTKAVKATMTAEGNARARDGEESRLDLDGALLTEPGILFVRAAKIIWKNREINAQGDSIASAVMGFLWERSGEAGRQDKYPFNSFIRSAEWYAKAGTIDGRDFTAAANRAKAKAARVSEINGYFATAGNLYIELGETQKAADMFSKAFDVRKDNIEVAHKLISAYLKLNMYSEAMAVHKEIKEFDEVVVVANEGARYHAGIGEYEKAGAFLIEGGKITSELENDRMGAIEMFARAIEMYRLDKFTGQDSGEKYLRRRTSAMLLATEFFKKGFFAAALRINQIECNGELLSVYRTFLEKATAALPGVAEGYKAAADAYAANDLHGLEAGARYLEAMALMGAGTYRLASETFDDARRAQARGKNVAGRLWSKFGIAQQLDPRAADAHIWRVAALQIGTYLKNLEMIRDAEKDASADHAALPKTAEKLRDELNEFTSYLDPQPDFSMALPYLLIRRHEDYFLKAWEGLAGKESSDALELRGLLAKSLKFAETICEENGLTQLAERARGNLKRLGVEGDEA